MSKADFKIENNKLVATFDSNEDGEPVATLNLDLNEGVQEAFAKGIAVEGVKKANVAFTGTQLVVTVDPDQDGESLLTLTIDLGEALDESGVLK